MSKRSRLLVMVAACLTPLAALTAQEAPRYAGATKTGFLLPNGWVVSPVGEQVAVADLPLNILPLPDSRHVLVATSGYNAHELSLIDLEKKAVVARQVVHESWFGLAASPRFDRIWWSGGGGNVVHSYELNGLKLTPKGTDPRGEGRGGALRGKSHFRSGLAFDPQRKVLYALDIDFGTITRSISRPRKSSSRPRSAAGPTTWCWRATSTFSTSRTGPVARSTSSIRPTCAQPRGSPWASTPTSSPSTPRMTGSSLPARRATPSR